MKKINSETLMLFLRVHCLSWQPGVCNALVVVGLCRRGNAESNGSRDVSKAFLQGRSQGAFTGHV